MQFVQQRARLFLPFSYCFLALAFIFSPSATKALEQNADGPALWKISDQDSEIFLFGTVHILNPQLKWRSGKVNGAFSASNTVVFEAPADTSNPQKMQAMIAQYGINPPGRRLSGLLSPAGNQNLRAVLAQFGMQGSESNFEPLRPWLAGITLAGLQIQATGGDPNAGVERILSAEAVRAGKNIQYFETDEQQMQFLSGLSAEAELYFLEDGLRQIRENPDQINELVTYWLAGDMKALDELMVSALAGQQEVYRVLLADRNKGWAEQIEELLAGSGSIFIAVGAGHLAGGDSVQEFLARKGIAAIRQ